MGCPLEPELSSEEILGDFNEADKELAEKFYEDMDSQYTKDIPERRGDYGGFVSVDMDELRVSQEGIDWRRDWNRGMGVRIFREKWLKDGLKIEDFSCSYI